MGCEFTLFKSPQYRRPSTNRIPKTIQFAFLPTLSILLPPSDLSLHPARRHTTSLLVDHESKSNPRSTLGSPSEHISLDTRRLLLSTVPHTLRIWTITIPHDYQEDQHRWHCGSPGRKVWRHIASGCSDKLFESVWRFVHHIMPVFLSRQIFHGPSR
jgi:hypothetical protein